LWREADLDALAGAGEERLRAAAAGVAAHARDAEALVAWLRSGAFRTDPAGLRLGPEGDKGRRSEMHAAVKERLRPLVSDTVEDERGQKFLRLRAPGFAGDAMR